MSQDDQQPDREANDRSGPSWMSRDTLLLLGALTFLILAVALTFLFPLGGQQNNQAASPTGGVIEAPTGSSGEGTVDGAPTGYPAPGSSTAVINGGQAGYPAPGSSTAVIDGGQAGYPAPGTTSVASLPGSESPVGTDTALDAPGETQVPDEPLENTALIPSATSDLAMTANAQGPYPVGSPVIAPTFAPAVITPTTAAQATSPPAAPQPTAVPQPTSPPAPTSQPTPSPTVDEAAEPTSEPAGGADEPSPISETTTPDPLLPLIPLVPLTPPVDVLSGNVRWRADDGPIILRRDVQLAPGAVLTIEPGVEVRLDPGVSIYVDGAQMLALGTAAQPVRFVGNTGARWNGLFGRPDSYIVMEHTQVQGGGAGGTLLAQERGTLVVRDSRFNDNGGAILLTDTRLEMRNSEVAGNDMPYGAAIDAVYTRGNFVTMTGNRIAGNRLSDGAPGVRIESASPIDTLNLELQGNLFRGGSTNLLLSTRGPLKGAVGCNAMVGDGLGLSLRTQTVQVGPNGTDTFDLKVENNFIDEHIPPIIPVYLKYGLGRGAGSEIQLDMRNNWWGEASGPYEPDLNPLGRGDSVGSNIRFIPWLEAPPSCAPQR